MSGSSLNPFSKVEAGGYSSPPGEEGKLPNPKLSATDRKYVRGYMKGLRGCDKGVKDLLGDVIVEGPDGNAHRVPIIWGSQEKALIAAFGNTIRKDGSGEITRVVLPIMALTAIDPVFSAERYTYSEAINWFRGLGGAFGSEKFEKDVRYGKSRGIPIDRTYILRVWTKYWEDMNQIIEQIMLKFDPVAYIEIEGVEWEVILRLDAIADNVDDEPGDAAVRIVKYELTMTAETYVPQPTVRSKTVLHIDTKFETTD